MANGNGNPLMRAFEPDDVTDEEAREAKIRALAESNPLMRAFVPTAEGIAPPTITMTPLERGPDTGDAFKRGVRRGTEFPFQLVGLEQAPSIAETTGQKVAEVAGEFVGFGISYIPFSAGASLLLRGVGLTAKMSRPMQRFVKGTLALGAFEAGGAESLEESPGHFLRGAAFGAAFEGVLLSRAIKHRAKLPAGEGKVANEDLLSIERQLRPHEEKSTEEIASFLSTLGDEAAQYEFVLNDIAQTYSPNGMRIIPGVRDPEKLIGHATRVNPELEFATRQVDELTSEVLFFDPTEGSRLIGFREAQKQAMQARKFMGEGPLAQDFKTAVEFIRSDVPGERIRSPEVRVGDAKAIGMPDPLAAGQADIVKNIIYLRDPAGAEISALSHEYGHLFTSVVGKGGERRWPISIGDVFQLSEKNLPIQTWNAPSPRFGAQRLDPTSSTFPSILAEFRDVSIEAAKRQGFSKAEVLADWGTYFGKDTELLARLIELMVMNPAKARELAPRATRMMAKLIHREGPKIKALASRVDLQKMDELLKTLWVQKGAGEQIRFLKDTQIRLSKKQMQQFISEGAVSGMGVRHNGKWYEWGGQFREGVGKGQVRLFDPRSGKSFEVPLSEVDRPILPRMARYSDEVRDNLRKTLEQDHKWVGFVVPHPEGGVQRGVVTLENFEKVSLSRSVMGRIDKVPRAVSTSSPWAAYARSRGEAFKEVLENVDELGIDADFNIPVSELELAVRHDLLSRGKEGLAVYENGILQSVQVVDDAAVAYGERLSEAFGLAVDHATIFNRPGGVRNFWELRPSLRNGVTSLLREQGVPEREIAFFADEAERMYADALLDIMDPEMKAAMKKSQALHQAFSESVEAQAARSNLKARQTQEGKWRVSSQDHVPLGDFDDVEDARSFISKLGADPGAEDPLKSLGFPTKAGNEIAGGGKPPKPQEQITIDPTRIDPDALPLHRRLLNSFNYLSGRWFSSMDKLAASMEEMGFGPAKSMIFDRTQAAIKAVDNSMISEGRAALGGRTFGEVIEKIHKLTAPATKERRELMARAVEYMTKSEIARPGGLLQRGMNELEIQTARQIAKVGLGHDVPRLQQLNRMMGLYQENRQKFLDVVLPQLETMARREQVNPNLQSYIERFRTLAIDGPQTKGELMEVLELSADERWLIDLLDNPPASGVDKFSIMAVSRYASAPELKSGFKSGREMFMTEKAFTAREREVVREVDNVLGASFEESGLDPRRMIGGYFPHLREYAQFMGVEEAEKLFRDVVPEAVEWVSARVRTGELDVYLMDPALSSAKHVRNMLMKQHFDPILPDVHEAIVAMKRTDRRAGDIMEEYMDELLGRPHASFEGMNQIMRTLGEYWGFEVSNRASQRFINTMVKVAHQATIPFRPALVIRNSWQSPQMTIPIIGPSAWARGLEKSMTEEGYKQAVKAGAIDLNITPVFAPEVLGQPPERLARLHPKLAEVGQAWEDFFNKGFDWYRMPDDVGRSIAYHGAKHRQSLHVKDFLAGKIDIDEFAARSKALIHDEPVVQQWKELVRAGDFDAAGDLLGVDLANMTHFRYGHANHPRAWGSAPMRLLGQFGTFPVQYKDLLLQMATRGTMKDKIEFFGGQTVMNGALIAAGGAVGLELFDWTAWPSMQYSGGPYADIGLNLYQSAFGNEQERRLARSSLSYVRPTFEDPQSIFIPGSYLIGDIADALDKTSLGEAFFEGAGFRFLEPGERDPATTFLSRAFGF